jgi:hypothetical protein
MRHDRENTRPDVGGRVGAGERIQLAMARA